MKPRAEPKLKVAVELEQAVRILSAMSRAHTTRLEVESDCEAKDRCWMEANTSCVEAQY